ncbi:hypothetical protein B0T17DRAFT_633893 [Bombardia bombarda]|uniref:Cell wall mannoprotein PIR1-like C-terminal domain-containing protein n=1 Tax=Bombardia bombarda TaxID=252184 RepID=A0AA40C9L7_9PEZI|nr:hypothetical protein B0T17DRAFT_633893 [Bombardia bombarda]
MKYQALALLTAVGSATAQGVTDKIAPTASAPAGCDASFDSTFEIVISSPENLAKRDAIINQKRSACPSNGVLVSELQDGVITDSHKRTGYIASNYQFQFDEPPQAGAIYTAGFSYCKNGSLALGGSSLFYQCQSGTFSNLYDRYWAPQCSPVEMMAMPCGGHEEAVSTNDEHVVATSFTATTVVVPLSDGQPQVLTTSLPIRLCQIDDGKPCCSSVMTKTSSSTTMTSSVPTLSSIPLVSSAPTRVPSGIGSGDLSSTFAISSMSLDLCLLALSHCFAFAVGRGMIGRR